MAAWGVVVPPGALGEGCSAGARENSAPSELRPTHAFFVFVGLCPATTASSTRLHAAPRGRVKPGAGACLSDTSNTGSGGEASANCGPDRATARAKREGPGHERRPAGAAPLSRNPHTPDSHLPTQHSTQAKPCPLSPPPDGGRLHLSQATLVPPSPSASCGRALLFARAGEHGAEVAVASLRGDGKGAECVGLDLIFDEYTEFRVDVGGDTPTAAAGGQGGGKGGAAAPTIPALPCIHLTGYHLPDFGDDTGSSDEEEEASDDEEVLASSDDEDAPLAVPIGGASLSDGDDGEDDDSDALSESEGEEEERAAARRAQGVVIEELPNEGGHTARAMPSAAGSDDDSEDESGSESGESSGSDVSSDGDDASDASDDEPDADAPVSAPEWGKEGGAPAGKRKAGDVGAPPAKKGAAATVAAPRDPRPRCHHQTGGQAAPAQAGPVLQGAALRQRVCC